MATIVSDYTALLSGTSWLPDKGQPIILTYSFSTSAAPGVRNDRPNAVASFSPLTEAEKNIVRAGLQEWSGVSGVIFIETYQNEGDLTFGAYNLDLIYGRNVSGLSGYPSVAGSRNEAGGYVASSYGDGRDGFSGDVMIDRDVRLDVAGELQFRTVVTHEIGHILGLKHPFDGDIRLHRDLDNGEHTVMSYNQAGDGGIAHLDIDAVRVLYGDESAKERLHWSWDAGSETLYQWGSVGSEFIRGTSANDVIDTGGGRDGVWAGAGNDRVIAYDQPVSASGGAGFDVFVTGLAHAAVTLSGNIDSFVIVPADRQASADWPGQVLESFERIAFSDGTLALDVRGSAGQAYRLYQAAFDRTPDTVGLNYWVDVLDAGNGLQYVADRFIDSREFALLYGKDVSNAGFVDSLYRNILGRDGDTGGIAFWNEQLDSGQRSRTDVLIGFSESDENVVGVAPAVEHGIWLG